MWLPAVCTINRVSKCEQNPYLVLFEAGHQKAYITAYIEWISPFTASSYLLSMHSRVLHINIDSERTVPHRHPLPKTNPALSTFTQNLAPKPTLHGIQDTKQDVLRKTTIGWFLILAPLNPGMRACPPWRLYHPRTALHPASSITLPAPIKM